MNLVFMMSTFDNQSVNIGCIGKLGLLFGFLRHYLLILIQVFISDEASNTALVDSPTPHCKGDIKDTKQCSENKSGLYISNPEGRFVKKEPINDGYPDVPTGQNTCMSLKIVSVKSEYGSNHEQNFNPDNLVVQSSDAVGLGFDNGLVQEFYWPERDKKMISEHEKKKQNNVMRHQKMVANKKKLGK